MSPVFQLLDAAKATVEDAVAPGRGTFLITGIVVVGTNVVFIRRRKGDRGFGEAAQPETGVLPSRCKKLVAVQELGEIVLTDGVNNDVAWNGINAIVEVSIQDADFVVHDHGAVASAGVLIGPRRKAVFRGQCLCFKDRSNVIVTVGCLGLARSQMAVDKAHRAVVYNEAENESTLDSRLEVRTTAHRLNTNLVAV